MDSLLDITADAILDAVLDGTGLDLSALTLTYIDDLAAMVEPVQRQRFSRQRDEDDPAEDSLRLSVQMAREAWEADRYAAGVTWTEEPMIRPSAGGNKKWRSSTGRIEYSPEMPGGKKPAAQEEGAEQGKQQQAKAEAPAESDPVKIAHNVITKLNSAEIAQLHVSAMAETLGKMTREQLHQLRGSLGLPTGLTKRKRSDLAGNILASVQVANEIEQFRNGGEGDLKSIMGKLEKLDLAGVRELRHRFNMGEKGINAAWGKGRKISEVAATIRDALTQGEVKKNRPGKAVPQIGSPAAEKAIDAWQAEQAAAKQSVGEPRAEQDFSNVDLNDSPESDASEANHSSTPEERAKAHQQLHEKLHGDLASSTTLPSRLKKSYGRAIDKVVGRMPTRAMQLLHANNDKMHFFESGPAANLAAIDDLLARSTNPEEKSRLQEARTRIESGREDYAVASYNGNSIFADGGYETPEAIRKGNYGAGSDILQPEIYAHEMGHAISGRGADGGVMGKNLHQQHEWVAAWDAEIKANPDSLTHYAASNQSEGFAEFCRLLYGTETSLDRIKSDFPLASRFFQKQGLWPEGKPEATGEVAPIKNIFDKEKRIVLDEKTGTHVDSLLPEPAAQQPLGAAAAGSPVGGVAPSPVAAMPVPPPAAEVPPTPAPSPAANPSGVDYTLTPPRDDGNTSPGVMRLRQENHAAIQSLVNHGKDFTDADVQKRLNELTGLQGKGDAAIRAAGFEPNTVHNRITALNHIQQKRREAGALGKEQPAETARPVTPAPAEQPPAAQEAPPQEQQDATPPASPATAPQPVKSAARPRPSRSPAPVVEAAAEAIRKGDPGAIDAASKLTDLDVQALGMRFGIDTKGKSKEEILATIATAKGKPEASPPAAAHKVVFRPDAPPEARKAASAMEAALQAGKITPRHKNDPTGTLVPIGAIREQMRGLTRKQQDEAIQELVGSAFDANGNRTIKPLELTDLTQTQKTTGYSPDDVLKVPFGHRDLHWGWLEIPKPPENQGVAGTDGATGGDRSGGVKPAATPAVIHGDIASILEKQGDIPIHEFRKQVAEKYGPEAASHKNLDRILKDLRMDDKIRLVPISDLTTATLQEMDDSVPGENETFYTIRPFAGSKPATTVDGKADAPKPKAKHGGKTAAPGHDLANKLIGMSEGGTSIHGTGHSRLSPAAVTIAALKDEKFAGRLTAHDVAAVLDAARITGRRVEILPGAHGQDYLYAIKHPEALRAVLAAAKSGQHNGLPVKDAQQLAAIAQSETRKPKVLEQPPAPVNPAASVPPPDVAGEIKHIWDNAKTATYDQVRAAVANLNGMGRAGLTKVADAIGLKYRSETAEQLRKAIATRVTAIKGWDDRSEIGANKATAVSAKSAATPAAAPDPDAAPFPHGQFPSEGGYKAPRASEERLGEVGHTLATRIEEAAKGGSATSIPALRKEFPDIPRREFDDALRKMRREGRLRLVAIGDRSRAGPDELANGVPGVNETLISAEPVDVDRTLETPKYLGGRFDPATGKHVQNTGAAATTLPRLDAAELERDIVAANKTDPRTAERTTIPAIYDALKAKYPELSREQFHQTLRDMQGKDMLTMQAWEHGPRGGFEGQNPGHRFEDLPDHPNGGGKAAYISTRTPSPAPTPAEKPPPEPAAPANADARPHQTVREDHPGISDVQWVQINKAQKQRLADWEKRQAKPAAPEPAAQLPSQRPRLQIPPKKAKMPDGPQTPDDHEVRAAASEASAAEAEANAAEAEEKAKRKGTRAQALAAQAEVKKQRRIASEHREQAASHRELAESLRKAAAERARRAPAKPHSRPPVALRYIRLSRDAARRGDLASAEIYARQAREAL